MNRIIENVTIKIGLARIIIRSVPDEPGVAAGIFNNLGELGFNIDLISAGTSVRPLTDITFTIEKKNLEPVLNAVKSSLPELGGQDVIFSRNVAFVSLHGSKIATTPGAAGQIFAALAANGINLEMVCGSFDIINFLIDESLVTEAVAIIKDRFGVPGI
jgi:aspartokinase